jgi:LCP family protein required for cell wall assembly
LSEQRQGEQPGEYDDWRPRTRSGNGGRQAEPGRSHKAKQSRKRRALKIVGGTMAVLVLVVAGLGTYLYKHFMGNIDTVSLAGIKNRPAATKPNAQGQTPQNILVLGSQTRDGQHGVNLGNASKDGTDLSDTAMLFHLSANRKWAVVVSIPRDMVVARPQCTSRFNANKTVPGENASLANASSADIFDEAMDLGGPACAVATVEQMTGVYVDHFVELTFNAFQQLTDAVGGVTVCIPPPGIDDPHYSGLVLGAGEHVISGAQSLEFIRDRHGVGDGTDLGRIQYQQMFVSSLFNQLTGNGTLSDPITLYDIANAITSNLTVDPGLDSLPTMVSLAQSVEGVKSKYIQLITAPYGFDPHNQDWVIPGQGFDEVWTDLRSDQPLPGSAAATEFGTGGNVVPGATASPTASPTGPALASLSVSVYNGTETPHLAAEAAANLTVLGVHTTVVNSGYSGYATTEILYPAGQQAQATALSTEVAGAVLKQSGSVSGLTLVIGQNDPADLTGAPAATAGATAVPSATISAESRTGDENICAALPAPNADAGRP